MATSISSGGDGFDINDTYQALLQQQPYIKFFNSQRGYVRHVVTPARWQADFQVLDKVSVPDGRLRRARASSLKAARAASRTRSRRFQRGGHRFGALPYPSITILGAACPPLSLS